MGKVKTNSNNAKHVATQPVLKSRKLLRKEKQQAKKQRKNEHYLKKFNKVDNTNEGHKQNRAPNKIDSIKKEMMALERSEEKPNVKNVASKKLTPNSSEIQSLNHKNEIKAQKKLLKQMSSQRKKQLLSENENEDRVIKKLEKQLRLNKRKSKSLPRCFVEEGLDYLLEVCDSEKRKSAVEAEMNLQDASSEFDEDFAVITGNKREKPIKVKPDEQDDSENMSVSSEATDINETEDEIDEDFKMGDSEDEIDTDDDSDNSRHENIASKKMKNPANFETFDDDSDFDGSELSEDNSERGIEDNISENSASDSEGEMNEDIYGRKRDKHGAVIQDTGKYIPPHLKAQAMGNSGRVELLSRLRKQIKGLLNRLAESNLHNIISQMDQLYMQNSRNDMNETLTKLIFESIIQPILVPERLIVENTMLISALHANVGTEVGAHFLQALVEKFDSVYRSGLDIGNKEVDNILLVIASLYSFKLFNCSLMFDILNRVTSATDFGEKEIELLLIVLRGVGFNLRKDDPVALKNIIMKVNTIVTNSSELADRSRVRFMLDVLTAIKNNNMTKVPNYDPSQVEHHKKLLKNLVHKGKYISELNITLDDLLRAPEQGKWWVVGSAWTGSDVSKPNNNKNTVNDVENEIDQSYLVLAKKHRMNTDVRRNIFCVLMSAEDFLDAFEKLLRLGLKGSQEQTILHVIVHCALQEKTFNPYYAFVAGKFCTSDRKHQMTLQYHLWDRIKELSDLKSFQLTNLALFLSQLILEKALPLSILKVIEFATLSKPQVRLLRRIFLTILLHNSDEVVAEVFQRISKASKLKFFKESIRLFFHHFILKNINEDTDDMGKLKERVLVAEKLMNFT